MTNNPMTNNHSKYIGTLVYPKNNRYVGQVSMQTDDDSNISITIKCPNFLLESKGGNKFTEVDFQNPANLEHKQVSDFFQKALEQLRKDVASRSRSFPNTATITMSQQGLQLDYPYRNTPRNHVSPEDYFRSAINGIQDQERTADRVSWLSDAGDKAENRHYEEILYMPTDQKDVFLKLSFAVGDAGTYRRATATATAVQRDSLGHEIEIDNPKERVGSGFQQLADDALEQFMRGISKIQQEYDPRHRPEIFGITGKAHDIDHIHSDGSGTGSLFFIGRDDNKLKDVGYTDGAIAFSTHIFDHDDASAERVRVQKLIGNIAKDHGLEVATIPTLPAQPTAQEAAETTAVFRNVQTAIQKLTPSNTSAFLSSYVLGEYANVNAIDLSHPAKEQAIQRYESLTRQLLAHDENAALDTALLADHRIADSMLAAMSKQPDPVSRRSGKTPNARGKEPSDASMHRRQSLSLMLGAYNTVIAAMVGGRARKNATTEETGGREAFVKSLVQLVDRADPCIAAANNSELQEEFCQLYDHMQPDFVAEVVGHGVSSITHKVLNRATRPATEAEDLSPDQLNHHADQFVGLLANILEPRINAIIEWNKQLGRPGFIDLEASTAATR